MPSTMPTITRPRISPAIAETIVERAGGRLVVRCRGCDHILMTVVIGPGGDAVEIALSGILPHPPAFADYDFGEWTTASDLFPQFNKPEDDYELI